jgi:CheY-like chemotaxis protein
MGTGTSKKRRILVVDDEQIVCDAARLMLEHLGHEVCTAGNGQEALASFERGQFDLVFTDYSMPGMRGDELAQTMKRLRPGQRVAMITAYADVLSLQEGVDMLISKPFLLHHLREAIEKLTPEPGPPANELPNRQRA